MSLQASSRRRKWIAAAALALVAGGGASIFLSSDCDVCEAANQILIQGTVAANCTINVTADPNASNLPLTASGAQRLQVGAILQSCNKKAGYSLSLTSTNCASTPTGGKVVDSVSEEYLPYSTELTNPTTGGSQADVTGLLASACTNQVGRNVTGAKVNGETSAVFVNFTGSSTLAAGTYQDTITISMNVK